MQYQHAIYIPVILAGLIFSGCTGSNEGVDTHSQTTIYSERVSGLCLVSSEGDSEVDKRIKRQIKKLLDFPDKLQTWVDLGNAWVKKSKISNDPGFYLHAQACVDYALKLDINYLPAQELQVQVLLNNHEFTVASKLASTIVTTAPDSRIGWASLSDAQLELGNIEKAQQSVEKLQDLQAGMAFFTRFSYLRWLRGDIKGANDALLAALQRRDLRNPHAAAWTFVQGAEISWHRNDLVGAEALYNESLKWLPDFPLALIGLARIEMARDNPLSAINILEKIKATKISSEAVWLLADASEMAGDQVAADKNRARVIALARTSDPLLLARFLSTKNRDNSLALELIENERRSRGGIYIEDAYAWVLYRLGRFEEAQIAIEKALKWGTKDAKLLFHAGAIKIAAGDIKGGSALVRNALSLQPLFDYTSSKEAAHLLQEYGDPANA